MSTGNTLLNTLSGFDRAIVTDIAGTTRDVIEENINVNGIPLHLIDTAGIRKTEDVIEKIGVERSRQSLENADLVINIIDSSEELDEQDKEILEMTKEKKRIIVANKSDIGKKNDISDCICISAKNGDGIDILKKKISELFNCGEINIGNGEIITNLRHKSALERSRESVENALSSLEMGMPQDIASIDICAAIDSLGEITGETVSEDIVSSVFKNFCVGK